MTAIHSRRRALFATSAMLTQPIKARLLNGLRFAPVSVDLSRKVLSFLMQTQRCETIDRALVGPRTAPIRHRTAF
jgi:hypothetical protein